METNYKFYIDSDLKMNFLDYKREILNETSYPVIKSRIISLDKYEKLFEKAVIDWDVLEIEDFLYGLNSRDKMSVYSYYLTLKEYGLYSFEKKKDKNVGLMSKFSSAIIMFDEFSLDDFIKYVNKRKQKDKFISPKEYSTIIEEKELELYIKAFIIFAWHNVCDLNDIFKIKDNEINFEKRYVVSKNDEKIYFNDREFEVLYSFYEAQKVNSKKLCFINNSIKYEYKCDNSSDLFFKPVKEQEANRFPLVFKENREFKKNSKWFTQAFNNVRILLNKLDLNANGIQKSGIYYRFVQKHNLTLDNYKKQMKKTIYRNELKKSLCFQPEDLLIYLEIIEEDEDH